MRKKDFLLCYDISDKKRLSKIAKIIEADAMRIQRSVYFYEKVSKKELKQMIERVLEVLDEKADDFRVYTIKNKGICLGDAVDLDNPLILL
jgi:CRISPR-associated protein Cas2